jgi:hypothetical protein
MLKEGQEKQHPSTLIQGQASSQDLDGLFGDA